LKLEASLDCEGLFVPVPVRAKEGVSVEIWGVMNGANRVGIEVGEMEGVAEGQLEGISVGSNKGSM